MNDPWNVKSVRQSGQYVSCMKISGVPLLPPVLSKECRKEMQYYKLLAKEVEKRISLLQPYISDTSLDSEDGTDAPELPEYEQGYELTQVDTQVDYNSPHTSSLNSPKHVKDASSNRAKSETPKHTDPNFTIDLSLRINQTEIKVIDEPQRSPSPPLRELPERDYNCISRITKNETHQKEVILGLDGEYNKTNVFGNFSIDCKTPLSTNPFPEILLLQEGPSSLSSKSFTGSLNDLHSDSIRESQVDSRQLVRQSSYTLLQPGPQLLEHLKHQALSQGVDINTISMSESLSDMIVANRKRKGWDLETAKEKWSKMALELKQKNVFQNITRTNVSRTIAKSPPKKIIQPRSRSVVPPPSRKSNVYIRNLPKSDPLTKTKRAVSPIRKNNNIAPPTQATSNNVAPQKHVPTATSESEDPATRVRELYEKIQNQQLIQMASLVEKQKKEQMLLQQVFEEQNNLLFKQLKTICPKSPVEPKEAWPDKVCDNDRGPVSLSQLINYKSPEQSSYDSSISSTLTDTNHYISHCDNILKKSRDITGSIKKEQYTTRSQNGTKIQSPRTQPEGSRTRTHSPVRGNTAISRKLNYDTSTSSDQNEPMLTDRTNDTMADLNVTFPSDHTDESKSKSKNTNSVVSHISGRQYTPNHGYNTQNGVGKPTSPDINNKTVERRTPTSHSTQSPIYAHNRGFGRSPKKPVFKNVPTPQERAAATKIVAYVKGYLVRRLMRTERVQGTVQTIKDALLCALQLHQDREGIRGADVDLHRRLIQQITAACYSLHDTFVASTPVERCAMIAADRGRRRSLAARQPNHSYKQTDVMSQSHSGSFPARSKRAPSLLMTQSNYETFSGDKSSPVSRRYVASPHRRPWR